jgi:hypothetical protein
MEGAVLAGKLAAQVVASRALGNKAEVKAVDPSILDKTHDRRKPKLRSADSPQATPITYGGGDQLAFRKAAPSSASSSEQLF